MEDQTTEQPAQSGDAYLPSEATSTIDIHPDLARDIAEVARLVPEVGRKVLFFPHRPAGDADAPNGKLAAITHVWGTGKGGCVNLDNGASSVPCYNVDDTGLPSGYYCLLFVDEPDVRDPNVPDFPRVYEPSDTSLVIFNRLEQARGLPEVDAAAAVEVSVPHHCIHHFKGADGRNMRIVWLEEAGFAQAETPRRAEHRPV
jgi:hypothetical protein